MDEQYTTKAEPAHIPARPQGAVEEPQIQCLRAAGAKGGPLPWEKARIEYERILIAQADKHTRELDERIRVRTTQQE